LGVTYLSPVTDLSRVQEQIAKTMTSLLIIPSVLAKVCYFFNHHAVSIKKAESSFSFLVFGHCPGSEKS
jgi:hypothetical protein